MADRAFDLVLFGATGFTGGLTADYLAEHAPADLRWALAGRNPDRLAQVRDRLAAANPKLADLPLLTADAADRAALDDVVRQTRVVATTVGPYLEHGGPLVAACALEGTDYADITGEPEFIDRTYVDLHATAERSGARLVHACGFDSVPHDIGAYFTVQQLAEEVGGEISTPVRMRGVVRASGRASGGTIASALTQMSRPRQVREAYAARRRLERRPSGRRSRAVAAKPGRDRELGYWLLPLATADPQIVARSGAALASYGPDFSYSHYAGTKTLRYAVGGSVGVAGLLAVAQVAPLRKRLQKRLPAPGEGDGPEARARAWYTVDFVAETEVAGKPVRVHTRVTGPHPYDESAKGLAESALSLAFDDNPETTGQVTTAEAMGEALLARLRAAGTRFERVS